MATVLIIDDEQEVCDEVSGALGDAGYTTQIALSGEEGLAVALDKHPDLILLDVRMPNMDGLEVLQRLRTNEWGAAVPILLLTNSDDVGDISKAVESTASGYLLKSNWSLADIVKKVSETVSKE